MEGNAQLILRFGDIRRGAAIFGKVSSGYVEQGKVMKFSYLEYIDKKLR